MVNEYGIPGWIVTEVTQTIYMIVLIDDDIDFLEVNRCILEAHGYQVICFTDPQKALAHILRERPDLVMTDLMMGAFDAGFSVARSIKTNPQLSTIPVMIVSAVSSQLGLDFQPRSRQELQAMGADAFLSKPVEPQTLIETIDDLLAAASERRQGGAVP